MDNDVIEHLKSNLASKEVIISALKSQVKGLKKRLAESTETIRELMINNTKGQH